MAFVRPNIAAMAGYVPGEQPQTGKFIKLNTNENPYPPSPKVAAAIQAALETGLMRYPDALATPFRHRAAEVLGVDPDWILCGNGSDDILTILIRAFVGESQRVRFPNPSYILYGTLAEIQGAQFETVPFEKDWTLSDAFWEPQPDLKLVCLPNPNSPSGTMISGPDLAAGAERLACPLLIDEAYVDFADQHCLELVKRHPNVVVSRTLSKSYGLAGLRFGFLVGQPQVVEELRKVKDSYNCDSLSIAGATAAIDDQKWLLENRRRILATRARLTESLRTLGFEVVPSQANFVWCKHQEQSSERLYEELKSHRILVRFMKYPDWDEGLRISVGSDEQIDACLSILSSLV